MLDAYSALPGVSVEPGWGAGNIVLKARGKIFAMCVAGELVVKLEKSRVDELVGNNVGHRFDPRRNGRVMKEWLVLPEPASDWVAHAGEALQYVGGARAKARVRA